MPQVDPVDPSAPRPLHAPWAAGKRPFTIAMAPVALDDWLEVDDRRAADLTEKAAVLAAEAGAVRIAPGTEAAQQEAHDLIAAELDRQGLARMPADPPERLADGTPFAEAPPLVRAAMMVPDDLVLMRRGEEAWSLAAAAVAFPSAWSLDEKFGRPMNTIHEKVPGWAGPMAARVARIFDNLAVDAPVWRLNWSIQFGGGLAMLVDKHRRGAVREVADPMVRVERQTLRRLQTGDLLFTIKVMVDPLAAIAAHPEGAALATHLADQLDRLDGPQLAYKGLTHVRDELSSRLRAMAG